MMIHGLRATWGHQKLGDTRKNFSLRAFQCLDFELRASRIVQKTMTIVTRVIQFVRAATRHESTLKAHILGPVLQMGIPRLRAGGGTSVIQKSHRWLEVKAGLKARSV